MQPDHPAEDEILEQALKLSGEQRAAYLQDALRDDDPLRRRIERLILASEQAGDFLDQPAAAGTFVITTSMIPVTEKPGDKIGRYKLREKIGEGGCGVVYVAEQEEPVRRRVALKVIKLGMDTRQVVARFEAERQALALMDHPNIAKVLDAGATDTGRPYFVMELVRGIKITDYCDQNNLATEERLKLFILVCSAIQHAHQKGIIHRDIKPSNILVTLHDGVPVPKVIDFGIAKATTNQRLTDKTVYTAFEQFLGTPAYMSPEQAEMSGLDIDTRSDIYSLGVLLYELLTGQTPFDATTLLKAGLDKMRRMIREQEPQRPSTRLSTLEDADLTVVARHRRAEPPRLIHLVRGDLDWIVMKSLEKDRTRRFETVNALAMDVKRHIENEPVFARPPSHFYRLQKLVRRNKLAVAVSAGLTVAIIIGLSIATSLMHKERQARERALVAEKAQNQLRQESELYRLRSQARDFAQSGNLDQAEAKYRELLEMQARLQGNEHMEVVASLENLADVLLRRNHNIQQTWARYTGQGLAAGAPAGLLQQNLKVTSQPLPKLDEPESMYRAALAIRRKLTGNENSDTVYAIRNLARVLREQDKIAEAESLLREALAIGRTLERHNGADYRYLLGDMADVLCEQNKLDEAESLYREALDISRKVHSQEDVAYALDNLAGVLKRESKLAQAESCYREALAIERRLSDEDDARVDNLVGVLLRQGKLVDAEDACRTALSIRKTMIGSEDLGVAYSLRKLAKVLAEGGKESGAEAAHREALAIEERHFHEGDASLIAHAENIAWNFALQTNYEEGDKIFEDFLALYRQSPSNVVSLLLSRGNLRVQSRRWKEAAADFSRAVELDPGDDYSSFCLAPLLVECKELEAYRRLREELTVRFASADRAQTLRRTVRACLLLPEETPELPSLIRLADAAIAADKDDTFCRIAKALADYREGHYENAIEWSHKALSQRSAWEDTGMQASMILAMALYRQGNVAEAREVFNKGAAVGRRIDEEIEKGGYLGRWHEFLYAHIIFHEARTLIESQPGR